MTKHIIEVEKLIEDALDNFLPNHDVAGSVKSIIEHYSNTIPDFISNNFRKTLSYVGYKPYTRLFIQSIDDVLELEITLQHDTDENCIIKKTIDVIY